MTSSFDIWKMLAGVAFFLLAMNFIEDSLRLLAGRRFKLFLKRQTSSKIKAIGGAAVVTGVLQSSSIVNLLVLSMVGASVLKMENALALVLGANLGTTLDSWLVATLGFNFNIENLALPAAAVTGISMAFVNSENKLFLWLRFLFSLAFLFISLGFIKTGMEGFVKQTDLSAFTRYPVIIFLLLGILLTGIIQSSSATIALTLSALHTNAITLYMAMAIVLGSEVGTTFKLFLASAKGSAGKKRIALGNFIFNAVTVSVMFLFLRPMHVLLRDILPAKNDLVTLVVFQSLVNLVCILLFLPLLGKLGKFLMKRYTDKGDESAYISKVSVADTGLALEALENETNNFINYVAEYSFHSFDLPYHTADNIINKGFYSKTVTEKYDFIKQLYGGMHAYYLKLQNADTDKTQTERLDQLASAIRNIMYAAKNIRDAQHDIIQIRNSSNDIKYDIYTQSGDTLRKFYQQVQSVLNGETRNGNFEKLTSLYQQITREYPEKLQLLYKENLVNRVREADISTLINFNRELYTSFKSVLFGLKDYLLTAKEAECFDALPGFIR